MGIFSSNKKNINEIQVRSEVLSDPSAYECLRVWMREDVPYIHVEQIKVIDDPRVWGSVLADVAAYAADKYHDKDEALAAIQEMFDSLVSRWVEKK